MRNLLFLSLSLPRRALTLWWPGMVWKTSRRSGCKHNAWVSAGAPPPVCLFVCLTPSATHTLSARWEQPRHPHATSSLSTLFARCGCTNGWSASFSTSSLFLNPELTLSCVCSTLEMWMSHSGWVCTVQTSFFCSGGGKEGKNNTIVSGYWDFWVI